MAYVSSAYATFTACWEGCIYIFFLGFSKVFIRVGIEVIAYLKTTKFANRAAWRKMSISLHQTNTCVTRDKICSAASQKIKDQPEAKIRH
jgi:hypothetical protein